MNKKQTPWEELYYLAITIFKLAPSEFWQMTVPELIKLCQCHKRHNQENFTPSKLELSQLMQQFPDN